MGGHGDANANANDGGFRPYNNNNNNNNYNNNYNNNKGGGGSGIGGYGGYGFNNNNNNNQQPYYNSYKNSMIAENGFSDNVDPFDNGINETYKRFGIRPPNKSGNSSYGKS